MIRRISAALFLICVPLLLAQSDSNSITVTASRQVTIPADQAVFSVVVTSALTTTLDDVLAAVAPAGITLANFSSVSTGLLVVNQPQLQWMFTVVAPLTNTKATVATLTNLQTAVEGNSGLIVSFSLQNTQVSPQTAQSQTCPYPDLISDANAKAQVLAAAAHKFVSGIVALAISSPCVITVKFSLVGS